MQERDKQIIDRFTVIIPQLSEFDKEYLFGFGNGMAANAEIQEKKETLLQTN